MTTSIRRNTCVAVSIDTYSLQWWGVVGIDRTTSGRSDSNWNKNILHVSFSIGCDQHRYQLSDSNDEWVEHKYNWKQFNEYQI